MTVDYFAFTAIHSPYKFSNEQQILVLNQLTESKTFVHSYLLLFLV